jgi:hypothetical protein
LAVEGSIGQTRIWRSPGAPGFQVEAIDVGLADLLDARFDFAEHRHAGAYLDASLAQIGDSLPHR